MGSPDSFRSEPLRAAQTIDDAYMYMDGVAMARWTPDGRVHVASYVAGLSYSARLFSFYSSKT